MITSKKRKTILIFGAGGFIGSNLVSFFEKEYEIRSLKIDAEVEILKSSISEADIILHAAGVSRSSKEEDFFKVNIKICVYRQTSSSVVINTWSPSNILIYGGLIRGSGRRFNKFKGGVVKDYRP